MNPPRESTRRYRRRERANSKTSRQIAVAPTEEDATPTIARDNNESQLSLSEGANMLRLASVNNPPMFRLPERSMSAASEQAKTQRTEVKTQKVEAMTQGAVANTRPEGLEARVSTLEKETGELKSEVAALRMMMEDLLAGDGQRGLRERA